MPETRLKEFLDREHVKYVSIGHSPAFTAQEVRAALEQLVLAVLVERVLDLVEDASRGLLEALSKR